jgi:transposase-like protein
MGWRVSSAMDEKLRFVFEYERDEESMRALCERFGISRETGYVWLPITSSYRGAVQDK